MKAANALKRERRHSIARYYHGENTNVLTTDCLLHMLSILCSICSDLGYLVLGDRQKMTGAVGDTCAWEV